jgi:molybdenum cofactor cytidylyltransferase
MERSATMVGVNGILLAAGASQRLGFPKQLVQIKKELLVRRTARVAVEVFPLTVVLGHRSEECRAAVAGLNVAVLENPNWEEGIASSIRLGVERANENGAQAVVLLVVDQYQIDSNILRAIIGKFDGQPDCSVAASYAGVLGTPVLFGSGWFQQLLSLRGDYGARALLKGAINVASVSWPAGAEDLDTISDLQRCMHGQ